MLPSYSYLLDEVLLERTDDLLLLLHRLIGAVTELAAGVDPFELDLLQCATRGVGEHRLAQRHDPLLDTRHRALEQHEVVLDDAIADEATQSVFLSVEGPTFARFPDLRSDGLVAVVEVGGRVLLVFALANAVNLVVDRSAVVVTHLTSTSNSPLDVGRMPSTNTSNFAETLVRLARQLLGAPSAGDTLETVAFGNSDAVNHLVLLENAVDLDRLLKESVAEVNLVSDGATVDLDFHEVGLLLLERGLADLGVGEDADDGAVLLDALEVASDALTALLRMLFGVLGEGLLLALVPVLVESALDLVGKVLSPHSGQ